MILPLTSSWQHLRGCAEHESAHIRFTDFKLFEEGTERLAKKTDREAGEVKLVVNALEDYRVEKLFMEIFPGAKHDFSFIYKEPVKEPVSEADKVLVRVMNTLHGFGSDELGLKVKDLIDRYMTFGSVLRGALMVLSAMPREPLSRAPSPLRIEPSSSCKSKLVSKDDLKVLEVDEEEVKHKLEGMKAKIEKSLDEERKKLEAETKDIEDGVKDYLRRTKTDYEKSHYKMFAKIVKSEDELEHFNMERVFAKSIWERVCNDDAGLISSLRTQLVNLRARSQPTFTKSGKLKINRAIAQIASEQRQRTSPFTKVLPAHGADIAILVDQSGSMRREGKMDEARRATIIFSKALEALPNVRFAVYGFNSVHVGMWRAYNTYQYKDFDEPLSWRVAMMCADGANRDGFHFRVVADLLRSKGRIDSKKIFLILSDGMPCDDGTEYEGSHAFDDTRRAINEIRMKGIVVLPIGFHVFERGWQSLYGDTGIIVQKNLLRTMMSIAFMIERMVRSV